MYDLNFIVKECANHDFDHPQMPSKLYASEILELLLTNDTQL